MQLNSTSESRGLFGQPTPKQFWDDCQTCYSSVRLDLPCRIPHLVWKLDLVSGHRRGSLGCITLAHHFNHTLLCVSCSCQNTDQHVNLWNEYAIRIKKLVLGQNFGSSNEGILISVCKYMQTVIQTQSISQPNSTPKELDVCSNPCRFWRSQGHRSKEGGLK